LSFGGRGWKGKTYGEVNLFESFKKTWKGFGGFDGTSFVQF